MFKSAFQAAVNAPKEHNFKVGDKVQILNPDYYLCVGEVVGFSTNLMGKPLVVVAQNQGKKLVFYSNELRSIDE